MRSLLFSIIAMLFLACSVEPPEGQLKCETAEDCPPDWTCDTDMLCYSVPDSENTSTDGSDSDTSSNDSDTTP